MAKYVLLYSGGSPGRTPDEQQKFFQAWEGWFRKLGKAVADPGNPFSDKPKNIASDGKVKEGAIGDRATGYSIVEASSLDEATEHAKACPILTSGGRITVYETVNPM